MRLLALYAPVIVLLTLAFLVAAGLHDTIVPLIVLAISVALHIVAGADDD